MIYFLIFHVHLNLINEKEIKKFILLIIYYLICATNILYTPILFHLLIVFDCNNKKNNIIKEVDCWKGILFYINFVLSIIFGLMLFFFTYISQTIFFDITKGNKTNYSNSLLKNTSKPDVIFLFIKTLNTIIYLICDNSKPSQWILLLLLFISSFILLYYNYTYERFNNYIIVFTYKFFCLIYLWITISLTIGIIMESCSIEFDGCLAIVIIGIPLICLNILFENHKSLNKISINIKIKSPNIIIDHIKNLLLIIEKRKYNRQSYLLLNSYIMQYETYCKIKNCSLKKYLFYLQKGRDLKNLLYEHVQFIYRQNINKFKNSVDLRLSYIKFLIYIVKNKKLAIKNLHELKSYMLNLEQEFLLYRFNILCNDEYYDNNNLIYDNNNELIKEKQYIKYFKKIKNKIIEVINYYIKFWTQLQISNKREVDNLIKLNKICQKILYLSKDINNIFEKLQEIKLNDIEVLKLYSEFLYYISGDNKKVKKFRDIILDSENNENLKTNNIKNFNINEINNNDEFQYIVVNANLKKSKLGEIYNISLSVCEIFGYKKKELIGKKINKIIPNIYQKEHDKILYKKILNYQKEEKNEDCLSKNSENDNYNYTEDLLVYGKSKLNFLLELYMKITLIETEDIELFFIAEINKDNIYYHTRNNIFDNEYCYLLTDDKFIIQNFSSNTLKFLGLKYSHLKINADIIYFIKQIFLEYFEIISNLKQELTFEEKILIKKNIIEKKYIKPTFISWKNFNNDLTDNMNDFKSYVKYMKNNEGELNYILTIKNAKINNKIVGFIFKFEKITEKNIEIKENSKSSGKKGSFRTKRSSFISQKDILYSNIGNIKINSEFIPQSNFNFQFDLKNISYKPKYEITDSFTKELEHQINNQLENKKLNENKKQNINNLNISSSSSFTNSFTSSEDDKEYSSSLENNNIYKEIELEKEKNNLSILLESKNENLDLSKSANGSSYFYSNIENSSNNEKNLNIKDNQVNVKKSNMKLKRQSKNLNNIIKSAKNILLNGDYYRIKNFSNIKLLIFNFDKKIAIENTDPNNYKSQIEVYLNESKRISDLEPIINPSNNLQPFLGSNKKIKFNYDKSNININSDIKIIPTKKYSRKSNNFKWLNNENEKNGMSFEMFSKQIEIALKKKDSQKTVIQIKITSYVILCILLTEILLMVLFFENCIDDINIHNQLYINSNLYYINLITAYFNIRELTLLANENYTTYYIPNRTEYLNFIKKQLLIEYTEILKSQRIMEKFSSKLEEKTYYNITNRLTTVYFLETKTDENGKNSYNIEIKNISTNYFFSLMESSIYNVYQYSNSLNIPLNFDVFFYLYNFMNNIIEAGESQTQSFVNEMYNRFKYNLKINCILIGIILIVNLICFYFFDKFFKSVVKKRESYLEVFYLIDKNLISNSLLKCELLLNYINEKDKQLNTNYIKMYNQDNILISDDINNFELNENTSLNFIENQNVQPNFLSSKKTSAFCKYLYPYILWIILFSIGIITILALTIFHFNVYKKTKLYVKLSGILILIEQIILYFYSMVRELFYDKTLTMSGYPLYYLVPSIMSEIFIQLQTYLNTIYGDIIKYPSIKNTFNKLVYNDDICYMSEEYFKLYNNESNCTFFFSGSISNGLYQGLIYYFETIRILYSYFRNLEIIRSNYNFTYNLTLIGTSLYSELWPEDENEKIIYDSLHPLNLFNYNETISLSVLKDYIIIPCFNQLYDIVESTVLYSKKKLMTIYIIPSAVIGLVILFIFFVNWKKFSDKLNETIYKTKNMLSIIPIKSLIKINNIGKLLGIEEKGYKQKEKIVWNNEFNEENKNSNSNININSNINNKSNNNNNDNNNNNNSNNNNKI